MNWMNNKVAIVFLGVLAVCLPLSSCADPRMEAANVVKSKLADRKAQRARSMELHCQAMEAMDQDNSEAARKYLNEALVEYDDNSHAWMGLGLLEYEAGDLYQAAQAFHRAARLEPLRYEPHFNLGIVLESGGGYSKAIQEYEIALKYAPDQLEVMENLARCYFITGAKLEKAQQLVERALQQELRPEWIQWLQRRSARVSATPADRAEDAQPPHPH